jgi:two-component system LytT family sensor kinase
MVPTAKDKLITVTVHFLLWGFLVLVLLMYPPIAGAPGSLPVEFWIKQILHILLMIAVFYFNSAVLVPKLLVKNKMVLFLTAIILVSAASSFVLARIDGWLNVSAHIGHVFGRKPWPVPLLDHFGFITMLMVSGISTSVTMVRRWNLDAKLRSEFESERIVAELSFLKAQIHPHFFFNTLNSIYALTYVNVETSRQVLHKLSRMMRYLLYETEQGTTLLSKELEFITDYIEIMQLRLNSNTRVEFKTPKELKEMPIAPMILLPFVENAFKHGVDDVKAGTIIIEVEQLPDGLRLLVKNTIMGAGNNVSEKDIEGKGIGVANTRRRLDLLYADKHLMDIQLDKEHLEHRLELTLMLI